MPALLEAKNQQGCALRRRHLYNRNAVTMTLKGEAMKKKNSPTPGRPNKSGNPRPKAGSPTPRLSQFKHVASSNYFQVEEAMFTKKFNPFITLLTLS
jgi:hypothetical protein